MFRDRVSNWARAHRWYGAHGQALSLEGKFRSPQHWEALPVCPGPAIDVLDAWTVELAWRRLPERSRWVLKYQYHDRAHPGTACRLIRKYAGLVLRVNDWRKHLRVAKHELALELGELIEMSPVTVAVAAQASAGAAQVRADVSP